MKNEELELLIKESITNNIISVESNKEKDIKLIGLGIYSVVSLLEVLGFTNNTEYLSTNGCDMDFGYDFEKNGENYHLWGSLLYDGFMFEKTIKKKFII